MIKAAKIAEIVRLCEEFNYHTKSPSGSPAIKMPYDVETMQNVPNVLVIKAYKWMLEISKNEYNDALKVWKLLPPVVWFRYFAMPEDYNAHPEVILLKARRRLLAKALKVRDRPDFFKKGKIKDALSAKTKNKKATKKNTSL